MIALAMLAALGKLNLPDGVPHRIVATHRGPMRLATGHEPIDFGSGVEVQVDVLEAQRRSRNANLKT